jgi:hypothetical protein
MGTGQSIDAEGMLLGHQCTSGFDQQVLSCNVLNGIMTVATSVDGSLPGACGARRSTDPPCPGMTHYYFYGIL